MYVKIGSYTGNGGSNAQTGFGFAPVAILIKRAAVTVIATWGIKTDGVTHIKTVGLTTMIHDDSLTLDADGFTPSNGTLNLNTNTGTYHYIAWGAAAADMAVFTYAGDNTDDRTVGSFTFTPDMALVLENDGSERPFWKSSEHGATAAQRFDGSTTTNYIQALQSGSIQVGTAINTTGDDYYVAVWKKAAGVFSLTEYTGDDADDKDIAHLLGATPTFAYTQAQNTGLVGWMKFSGSGGGTAHSMTGSADSTDSVQALGATNVQVGTVSNVGSSVYTLVTFADAAPAGGGGGVRHLMLLGVGT